MGKYEESISDDSLWITATPAPFAKTLPFFISEAGRFIANDDYRVRRDTHDSFLLLYTVRGEGVVRTGESIIQLLSGYAVMIDCHTPHEYYSESAQWEFLWIHFDGSGVRPLFHITYPENNVHAVCMESEGGFEEKVSELINGVRKNDLAAYLHHSSQMHLIFNAVYLAVLRNDKAGVKHSALNDIHTVIAYIEENYCNPITLEDMIRNIPVSKYHFIRRFKRAMGVTPYSYLTSYRINVSKTLLRSTNKTISEIAQACGFLDTSNFIVHFRKHTGQKPLQYRRDFS